MVYCGKLSKGCAPCRAKRTKCDQARPFCGQCRRAHRECPGYRPEQDGMFRNETSKVVTKAQARTTWENSKLACPVPIKFVRDGHVGTSTTNISAAPIQTVESTAVAIRGLSVSLEDQATYYFFHNFVSEGSTDMTAYSHLLPTLYRQNSSFSVLRKIVDAIGLASISNVKHAPELMVVAGQKYAGVLRAITASVQDSKEASTDQTLIAVMLLGLFETITCSNPESMRSWSNHVNGVSAIARLRGTDLLRTNIGRKIFAILRVQVLIDCLQRRLIIPPDFIEWVELEAEGETDQDEDTRPEQQLFLIIARLCALRAVAERSRKDFGVIKLANLIDSDLEDWKNGLPPVFSYSMIQSVKTDYVFSDTYHVYNTTMIAAIWNMYRCARILTQEVITCWFRRSSMNPALDELQRRQSEILFANLAYDICATGPFLLGASRSSQPPRAVVGMALLWPFYLVATMGQQLAGAHAWIIPRLEMIGRTMGIKKAESLAIVLRTRKEITAWDKFETARADEVFDDW